MLRPGGFIEYSPKEQQIFDMIYGTIEHIFTQHAYQHIHTPAVEKVETLKKGGDEVSKQIFGLYGLAQGPEDAKDYALHFDLTVPFARYVLDRQNELAFPFKRYQIQPVWRGERSQKGRYKEFRQADIDVIWKTKDDKNYNNIYDGDCVVTLAKTLSTIISSLGLQSSIVVRYNNKAFMQAVCDRIGIVDTGALFSLLDKYYKLPTEVFSQKLDELLTSVQKETLLQLRDLEKNKDNFPEVQTYIVPFADSIRPHVQQLQSIEIVYDPTIVRGLDYYTGTVFETFIDDRKDIGSICSGGAYENLTEFLDSRQSFSGVGGSIGLSRLMSVLLEEYTIAADFVSPRESYLIVNEVATLEQSQLLLTMLYAKNKIVEIYPTADKIDKQFRYAEKKGTSHIVQVFDGVAKVKKVGDTQRSVLGIHSIDNKK